LTQRGRKLGPPSGKKMIFHFDDINMPKLDLYGAQPPNELLRQIIDQGGFYDLKKHQFKQIIDCCMVASCSPPGGGRNPVTPRLFRHFHMLWMPDLSNQSMELIFKSILRGYLTYDNNTSKYASTSDELIKASVNIYQAIRTQLLPTPSKCHYTFNLRDLSKVVQGMLQMNYSKYASLNDLVRLWAHEHSRIFYDRLVNDKDRATFFEILLTNLKAETGQDMTKEEVDGLIFSDITDPTKEYSEVTDMAELLQKAELYLNAYNSSTSKRKLELVFFTDALKHLCRISRVLKQPRGNCLLIGVGGSGRQSLTRVAKAVNNYDYFMIEITKNYKEQKWREDLAVLLKSAGKDNKKCIFLFSDTQIVYESFLEDINNILNTGEVPNLWKVEDIDQICQDLRPLAVQMKREDNKDSLLELFVHQVRENLHIVLTFSPVGDKLRERCRQFPSIIDCCTIDWFERWPDEALMSVAVNQIKRTADETLTPHCEALAKIAVTMHNDVIENADIFYEELKRKYYITPTSYLELLKTYIELFTQDKNMIPFTIKKYTVGLEKLKETNEQVKILQDEIIRYQPILEKKAKETEIMKADLEEQNAIASEVEKKVTIEAEAAQSRLWFDS
jgi:dynein heavy chain